MNRYRSVFFVNYACLLLSLTHSFNNVNRLLIVLNESVVYYYYFYKFCLLLNVLDRTSDIWCLVLLSMLHFIKKSLVVTSRRDQLNSELIRSFNPLMKLNSTSLKLGRNNPCFNLKLVMMVKSSSFQMLLLMLTILSWLHSMVCAMQETKMMLFFVEKKTNSVL
jgi:hypothetical protein